MQRQSRLQTKGVTRTQTSHRCAAFDEGSSDPLRMIDRYGEFDTILARVPGAGNDALDSEYLHTSNAKSLDARCFRRHRGQSLTSARALHRQDGAIVRNVGAPDDGTNAFGIRSIRHHVERVLIQPPNDDVVGNPTSVVARMRVLGATGRNLSKIVRKFALQEVEGIRTLQSNGSQV